MRTRRIRSVLLGILTVNLIVALAKLGYGEASNSVGMSADGLNSLLDGLSNIIELVGVSVAARPADPNHPYGHRRFETLTSLVIVLFMVLALQEILQRAWDHWRHNSRPDLSLWTFLVMLAALLAVLGMTLLARSAGRRHQSSVLMAESRHLASDAAVSLSVIAGLVAVRLGYPQVDPIVAVLVAAMIAWAAWSIAKDAVLALSDVAPVPHKAIDAAARGVHGVEGVHNIRSRGSHGIAWVDLHIQVDPDLSVRRSHEIASAVADQVEDAIGQHSDVTVHVEPALPEHLRGERGYQPEEDASQPTGRRSRTTG